ncbi:MAG: hypothetical protein ACREBS_03540 [Nitrososphaerales archaeon]
MYDMTPDQHPIIDELSDMGLAGTYFCVGLSGHGFKLCPGAATDQLRDADQERAKPRV